MTTLQVSSTRATKIDPGYVEIFTYARETKDKKIEAANRTRAIIIPELVVTDLPAKFADFVRGQLYTIAKSQLAELWKENGNQWVETPLDLWTVDSLLAYAARTQETQRLNAELVKTVFAEFLETCDEKKRDAIRDALISCASPSPSMTLKQAEFLSQRITNWLADQEEEGHWAARAVLRKVDKHAADLKALDEAF